MEQQHQTPERLGWLALALGAIALIAAFVVLYAGSFAPQPAAAVSLGELAGGALKATARELLGRPQPAPIAQPWTVDDTVRVAVIAVSVLAIVMAAAAMARRERRVLPGVAVALGASALLLQVFAWLAMMIAGVVIILAVLAVIDNFFDGLLSGLFGG